MKKNEGLLPDKEADEKKSKEQTCKPRGEKGDQREWLDTHLQNRNQKEKRKPFSWNLSFFDR